MSSEIDFTLLSPAELAKAAMNFAAQEAQYGELAKAAKRELNRRKGIGAFVFPEFGLTVEIKTQKKFVASEAKKALPRPKYNLICVPTASATMARAMMEAGKITEADFAKCQKTYDNTVTVKFVEQG